MPAPKTNKCCIPAHKNKDNSVYRKTCHNDTAPNNMEHLGYINITFTHRFKQHNTAQHKNPESLVGK